jgi:hypothetical protein
VGGASIAEDNAPIFAGNKKQKLWKEDTAFTYMAPERLTLQLQIKAAILIGKSPLLYRE